MYKVKTEATPLMQYFVMIAFGCLSLFAKFHELHPLASFPQLHMLCWPAGVPCDLNVKLKGAKNTVTHHAKIYALNHAALVGVDYSNIKWLASHEVDVTRCD